MQSIKKQSKPRVDRAEWEIGHNKKGCDTHEVLSSKLLGATSLLGPATRAKPAYYRSMWLVVYCMGPGISLRILAGPLESLVSGRSPGRRDVCSAKGETGYPDKKKEKKKKGKFFKTEIKRIGFRENLGARDWRGSRKD